MLPQELDRLLAGFEASGELPRVKLIYVVSYYENPTGGSLAAERREDIVKLAKKWSRGQRICLLEDAAYRELQYDGPILPSLWSYDTERSHVILAQTFSKTFAPGLRTGYGIVPHDLVGPLCDRKGNEDFGSAHLTQSILARIMQGGVYRSHVEKLCRSYRRKRDAILSAIDRHLAHLKGVTWERPHGGLYVWMTLPSEIETGFQSPLFQRAVKHEQVMYVPGELFYAGPLENRPRSQMRLSFGILEDSQLEEAIRRLSHAIQAAL
jgi:2-aminoadipate transaminase